MQGTVVGVGQGSQLNIQAMIVCVLKALIFTPSWRILPKYFWGSGLGEENLHAPIEIYI